MTKHPRKKSYTRLILFSGGIDSAYLLAQALRDTKDTVLVHQANEVASEISKLIVITDDDIGALINRHAKMIEEAREKYGPKSRLGGIPS